MKSALARVATGKICLRGTRGCVDTAQTRLLATVSRLICSLWRLEAALWKAEMQPREGAVQPFERGLPSPGSRCEPVLSRLRERGRAGESVEADEEALDRRGYAAERVCEASGRGSDPQEARGVHRAGGKRTVDNYRMPSRWDAHLWDIGQMREQTKDLPPGTKITGIHFEKLK